MNKIEIGIFAFIFGMATMNNLHNHKARIYEWLDEKSKKTDAK